MEEKKQPRIKILVACHKADPNIRQDDIYMPIQVGKALHPELDLGFQCDNTGDNISEKNGSYCELTALYWAWKNLKDVDYIGLAHYRRYLDYSNSDIRPNVPLPQWQPKNEKSHLLKIVSPSTILASRRNIYPYSVALDYARAHHSDDLKTVYTIIQQQFTAYKKAFDDSILNSNVSYPYNMFIMPWDIFNEYCGFLFPLLEEVERQTYTRDYNDYQKRLIGFLAERLMNVYLSKKSAEGFKIKTLPVMWITDDVSPSSKIHYLINWVRYNLSFHISKPTKPSF